MEMLTSPPPFQVLLRANEMPAVQDPVPGCAIPVRANPVVVVVAEEEVVDGLAVVVVVEVVVGFAVVVVEVVVVEGFAVVVVAVVVVVVVVVAVVAVVDDEVVAEVDVELQAALSPGHGHCAALEQLGDPPPPQGTRR